MANTRAILCLLGLLAGSSSVSALTVVNPPSGTASIAAGDDFGAQVLGYPLDMSQPIDVDFGVSSNWNSQTIASGIYTGVVTDVTQAASFYPLFQGWGVNTQAHWPGELHGIDTSHYRYFTIKLRSPGPGGSGTQPTSMSFLKDGDSYGTGTFGHSLYKYIPQQGPWTIVTWDLDTEMFTTAPYHAWTEYPTVEGLRFDLQQDTNTGTLGTTFQVDWIRLTAPGSAATSYTVTWTDAPVGTYNVFAIDADSARFQLNSSAISGTSYAADFSRLQPGLYRVEVDKVGGGSATSSGSIRINTPPQVQITAPSIRGEQSASYAIAAEGHQWGPLSQTDFSQILNFSSFSFSTVPGSFYGRPANGDTQWWLALNGPIDANKYRSLCFTQQVLGPWSLQFGSVARIFWGPATNSMTTTRDIALYAHNTPDEYCFEDLATLKLEPAAPSVAWGGTINQFRIDPDEFPVSGTCTSSPSPANCHDVQLNSVILSPFARAAPSYTVQWNLTDPEASTAGAGVTLLLNPNRSGDLSQSHTIANLPYATGSQSFNFSTLTQSVPNGTYYLGVIASDGLNAVLQFAGGPLVVVNDDIFKDGFE